MICVVSDFDNTVTLNDDMTGFTTIEKYLSKDFQKFRINMKKVLKDVDMLTDYEKEVLYDKLWKEKYSYLKEANLDRSILDSAVKQVSYKDNYEKFLKYLYNNNIRYIINSAGYGDFIKYKLSKDNLLNDNTYILANFIDNNNDYITRVNKNKNKDYLELLEEYGTLIIIGDNPKDLSMIPHNTDKKIIKIAFNKDKDINYKKWFNHVIGSEDYDDIIKIIDGYIGKEEKNGNAP